MPEHTSDDDIYDYVDKAQGELGAIEADEGAQDWDELEDEEGLAPRVAKDVYTPTAREIMEHDATHIPAKTWCPACVEGKLANAPHRKRTTDGDKTVPEVGLDYAFLREANSEESLTILVMKDRDSKMIFADAVEMKGRGLDGTVQRVVENLARLGHKKVILRSDQEPAIIDLIAGVIAARDDPTIPRNSPVGESQSNGLVERAVRSSKDQIRILRLALQKRVGCRIPPKHDLMTWIVQHAGESISKYQVNRDGKTAYEKVWGEPCKDEVVEIGEDVHYRISEIDTGSLDARSASGVWLGKRWKSSEQFSGTPQGVVKSYAILRKPIEDRWNREAIEAVIGTPWKMVPSSKDISQPRVLPPLPADQRLRDPPKPKEADIRAPLRPRIKEADLSRWGFTDGCLRCRQMRTGKGEDGAKHSEKCRTRLEGEMRR